MALTRAKEKMIILADLNGEAYGTKNEEGVLEDTIRLKYRSFLDIIMSVQKELNKYVTKIDNISVTKDYEIIKKYNFKDYIGNSDIKLDVIELEKDNNILDSTSFSKKQNKLVTVEEKNNMNYGTKMHYLFEINDFSKTDDELINKFNSVYDSKKAINTYKEYEFMYEEDNTLYHGVIDLMFEYKEYIDIIDYKLSNIDDEAYLKQLDGYKKYIENKTNKKVNIYLYSIINNELKKL